MIEIVKFVRAGTIRGDRCFHANWAHGDVRMELFPVIPAQGDAEEIYLCWYSKTDK
jgi:hypothetical protein